ncbi:UNVERIFIED_CONTAM: hypothetical protein Sradi_1822200 [Sesamum radiatum]|uniref:GAG-pre-integrase domain-containing protein n=1 Tax=Sesamum radiatum TaxID=300843 RepID=A0AAW2TWK1_SESRA
MSQQELSLTAYLTKVTKLWNEISYLAPTPKCTCGACTCGINKAISDLASSTQLMQFLMGLHESYNNERSQILMMDPLPDIEKAFSMVYAVEKQREVQLDVEDKTLLRKKNFVDKRNLVCSHCRKSGHSQDNCFQLHGVPDWYKLLNDKKKKGKHFVASVEEKSENAIGGQTQMTPDVIAELLKFLQKNNAPTDPISSYANYVHFDEEFAGNSSKLTEIDLNCWIIDTGATNHICANIDLFQSYSNPTTPQFVHLPDGSQRAVKYTGHIKLNDDITIDNVLFIPEFSVNLLSVSQLCFNKPYTFQFTHDSCLLQDQETKAYLVKGVLFKKLYIYKQLYVISFPTSYVPFLDVSCSSSIHCNKLLWHNRLGHAPLQAIKHISALDITDTTTESPCDVCHKAKQSRIPFSISNS